MLDREEFPRLAYFLKCYYFLDWEDAYPGDWDAPLQSFIAEEKRERLVELKHDIDSFLARKADAAEIDAWTKGFHLGPLDMPEFLVDVRDRLTAALAGP